MNLLENIGTYLISISGICGVLMILVCIKNIMTTDEGEHRIYIKRMKNTIIAFVCIISVVQMRNITFKYFKPDDIGIGTIDSSQTGQKGSLFSVNEKDKKGRKVLQQYEYSGTKYTLVLQDSCSTLSGNLGMLHSKGLKNLYAWKLFSDCQGMTSGALANIHFYSFSDDLKKLENKEIPLYYCGDDNKNNPSSLCEKINNESISNNNDSQKLKDILKDHNINVD